MFFSISNTITFFFIILISVLICRFVYFLFSSISCCFRTNLVIMLPFINFNRFGWGCHSKYPPLDHFFCFFAFFSFPHRSICFTNFTYASPTPPTLPIQSQIRVSFNISTLFDKHQFFLQKSPNHPNSKNPNPYPIIHPICPKENRQFPIFGELSKRFTPLGHRIHHGATWSSHYQRNQSLTGL